MSKTVLLVSNDKKTISQVARWLKELPDDVVCETAASLDELKEKFLSRAVVAAEPIDGESNDTDVLRLLIFDVGVFGAGDPTAYISQTRSTFQSSHLCTPQSPLKVMILSYDNASIPSRIFIHQDIDDLLMKPLDHQLFLQKTGMLLADQSSTEGNFLFKQKAHFIIEMAKDARIVKMSEFGIAISNPSPIAPGVFAHFYSPLFGTKNKTAVWGRFFNSRRDPKNPGHYICFLTFFGIQADQLMTYRRTLRDRRKELRFYETGYDRTRVPAAVRHVAIIERNPTNAQLISDALSTNFLNLKTYKYSSYAQFLKAISGSAVATIPSTVLAEGVERAKPFDGELISFFIRIESADLLRTEPAIKSESRFCGSLLSSVVGTTKWLDHMVPADKDEWDEFLLSLQRGNKSQATLNFRNINGEFHAFLIRGETARDNASDGSKLLQLEFHELSHEELEQENHRRRYEHESFPQIDAVYVDANSIREFGTWYQGLKELLKKSNLLIGEKLPVCLLVEDKSKITPADFRTVGVADFIYKPIDRRFIVAKAAVLVTDLVASNDNVDLSFTPADLPVKIAKEVELNEVAEFGFQIKSNIPLRENVFLRFFSPLFLDESGDGVLARCSSCVPDQNDKQSFGCFFSFFGVTDGQLKHIRNWIREDYVSKKDSEAG